MFQFVADNADANICTLDGAGTFHGLGVIKVQRKGPENLQRIRRVARISVCNFTDTKCIPELRYVASGKQALKSYRFVSFRQLLRPHMVEETTFYTNLLWLSSHFVRSSGSVSADWLNWSGFATQIFSGHDEITEDHVSILPLLDLDPNDENTIYSCVSFIANEARRFGLSEVAVTFDQPLYYKAQGIVMTERLSNVVVRLGAFHLIMSAIGSIMNTMKGSGIDDVLGTVYGSETIKHIMSGKAIARALRAVRLLQAALMFKLLQKTSVPDHLIVGLSNLIETIHDGRGSLNDVLASNELVDLESLLSEVVERSRESRTAKLWLQFMDLVNILHTFISCERLKNWEGHLNTIPSLLTLFAATGHIHYARSGRLYLQEMRSLETQHPQLYKMFVEHGMHAVHECRLTDDESSVKQIID
jgi:hypothetical protein